MRLALGVSYRGTAYLGWQSQPNGRTVQDVLEQALSRFADQPVRTLCAGRTDTGVHGLNQVVHLDTEVEREPFSWIRGTNRYLPDDVALQWCQAASPVKTIRRIDIERRGAYWRFDFDASAFLHHMVRNIMGCLLMVGSGVRPAAWMAEVLASRSRQVAAPTFAPDGLYFIGPYYDPSLGLPAHTATIDWLP